MVESNDIAANPDFTGLLSDLTATFNSGKTRELAWRRKQLKAVSRMMDECESDLFGALKSDLGKCAMESFTTETAYVSGDAAYSCKKLGKWTRKKRVSTPVVAQPGKSWIQAEPLGVVLVIGAWNYPVQLTLAGMSAAIAAGQLRGHQTIRTGAGHVGLAGPTRARVPGFRLRQGD